MKTRPLGAVLFHADGRTDGRRDMTKRTVTFRRFANALKMYNLLHQNAFGFQGRDVSNKKIIT